MTGRYIVDLTDAERETLLTLTSSGSSKARRYRRARVLLLADQDLSSCTGSA